ncbi:MAG: hypothetical protein RR675_05385, partial [Oscillospiraceae bacterium]
INFNTGAGNEEVDGALEDAKRIAENGMCYTQKNVDICTIANDEKEIVSSSRWWGCAPSEDDIEDENVLQRFGDFGFYSQWSDN